MLEILFEPQNTEEMYRIRGNWVHVQLGQIMDKKMQKDQVLSLCSGSTDSKTQPEN